MPDFVWSDSTLTAVARLLREYHDVVRGFSPPPGAIWQVQVGAPDSGPLVCHNDIAPYNTVFQGDRPVGFIDWDLAAPGPALYDVAHAVWYWVPLYDAPEKPRENHGERLRLFCDAYELGPGERQRLLPTVRRRVEASYRTLKEWGEAGKPGWAEMWRTGHADGKLDSLRWLDAHWQALEAALRS